jgi:hypothetical protein
MCDGFSQDSMRAYIEFWDVMQAIVIQQDAICQLHEAVLGTRPNGQIGPAWSDLREKRNLCAGTPRASQPRQRTYMGRDFGDYDAIKFVLYDEHTEEVTVPFFQSAQDDRGL